MGNSTSKSKRQEFKRDSITGDTSDLEAFRQKQMELNQKRAEDKKKKEQAESSNENSKQEDASENL